MFSDVESLKHDENETKIIIKSIGLTRKVTAIYISKILYSIGYSYEF